MTSVGKKIVSGITGLALCGFIVAHLAGNLLLLVGAEPFNEYTLFLSSFAHGLFLPVAESGLVVLFLAHAFAGIRVHVDKRRARPDKNVKVGSAGGPSQKTLASRTMLVTGILLLLFLIGHVYTFRLGPAEAEGYVTMLDGHEARDLYRLVIETFKDPVPVVGYTLIMLLLGFHLWHGFWSAFQSLGANNPKYMPLITTAGVVFAIAMAVGFLMIPIWIYLFVDPPAAAAVAAAVGGGQ
jgi:succinate dehydrogenase / fumarate reductase cytochrome b subunit